MVAIFWGCRKENLPSLERAPALVKSSNYGSSKQLPPVIYEFFTAVLHDTNIQKRTVSIVTTVLEQPDERNSQPLRFGSFGSRELPERGLKYW